MKENPPATTAATPCPPTARSAASSRALALALCLILANSARAQAPLETRATDDLNRIDAAVSKYVTISADGSLRSSVTKTELQRWTFDAQVPDPAGDIDKANYLAGVALISRDSLLYREHPPTFEDYLHLLAQNAPSLDFNVRALILRILGGHLLQHYNYTDTVTAHEDVSLEVLYETLATSNGQAGVCRDIHAFLAQVATALGLEYSGVHDGAWGNQGHVIAQFREPGSQDWYILNYVDLIDTHQKDLVSAIDVSTRYLGGTTGASYVESRPGEVHVYEPRTARWSRALLENAADLKQKRTLGVVELGAPQNQGLLEKGHVTRGGGERVGGFVVGSDYRTADGDFRMAAAGVSNLSEKSLRHKLGTDEIHLDAKIRAGYIDVNSPTPRIEGPARRGHPSDRQNLYNPFGDVDTDLSARKGAYTLSANTHVDAVDIPLHTRNGYSGPYNEASASLTHTGKHRTETFERLDNVAPSTLTHLHYNLHTGYDKASETNTAHLAQGKLSLQNTGSVYVFEGIDRPAGLGVSDQARLTLHTQKGGTLTLTNQIGANLADWKNDPFYHYKTVDEARLSWKKDLRRSELEGSFLYRTSETPMYYLYESTANPALKENKLQGELRWTFQK